MGFEIDDIPYIEMAENLQVGSSGLITYIDRVKQRHNCIPTDQPGVKSLENIQSLFCLWPLW